MRVSRRTLFKYSVDELVAVIEESRGRRNFKLSELGELGPEELGRLIPAIMDASNVTVEGGYAVVSRTKGRRDMLFQTGSKEEDVWSRIDGRATVRAIADALAQDWSETADTAFARVRHVFLALVRSGVCRPCNPLE